MTYFYDTCSLLSLQEKVFEDNEIFYISHITLQELENIKTAYNKDEETKFKARKLLRLLVSHEGNYNVIFYNTDWDNEIANRGLQNNNDMKIIYTAYKTHPEAIFVTEDLACKMLCRIFNLTTQFSGSDKDNYTGYKEITLNNEELAEFYSSILYEQKNKYNLLNNEYLIVKTGNQTVDSYKWSNNKYNKINYNKIESKMFGKITPQDDYQALAIDSLINNQLTVLRGKAGSGKSYLGLGYLLTALEKNKIDKIIIFCNTVATKDSCKLGFYPGSKNEKLLDSQIGNFLIGKLGDICIVEDMINKGKLVLVPIADCRGMDTTGMNAGIYITEAQNTTVDMMKLVLQRIGEDSICVIEGDDKTQVDMNVYNGKNNGLRRLSEVFRGEDYYGEVTLQECHRSKIAKTAEKL